MPTANFSDAFPVLGTTAYLNAGTCGPFPAAAVDAMTREVRDAGQLGRGARYYGRLTELAEEARAAWSLLLRAPTQELALTGGASEGITRVLALIDWQPGDQVVTSDEEHPGVLGPLGALARRSGVQVITAPWDEVARTVSPATKLVVVSHVSWLRGRVANLEAIGAAGAPVLVDAAQAAGAIAVDLTALREHGIIGYASAGQKWTCGPVGTGSLWVDELWAPDRGIGIWPTYSQLANPADGLDAEAWPDARRLDAPSLSVELLAGSVASHGVLAAAGWEAVHGRAVQRAAQVAAALHEAGHDVAERGPSTLVAWRTPGPEAAAAAVTAAADRGVVIRAFAGEPWLRASIGAWTTDDHIERLLAAAA